MTDRVRRRRGRSNPGARPFWLGEDERKWDHVRVHIQLMQDPRTDLSDIGVYACIAIHAEVLTGEAEPSQETLATYGRCSERHVRTVTKRLEKWRYIDIIHRVGLPSIYRLLPPPALPSNVRSTPEHPSGVTPESGAGVIVEPRNDVPTGPEPRSDLPRNDVPETPEPRSDELEETRLEENPLTPYKGDWRKMPRAVAREVTCPKCGALPGEQCLREDGQPREANHAERVMARATGPQQELVRRRERIENCGHCEGRGLIDLPSGEVARCPKCRSEAVPA